MSCRHFAGRPSWSSLLPFQTWKYCVNILISLLWTDAWFFRETGEIKIVDFGTGDPFNSKLSIVHFSQRCVRVWKLFKYLNALNIDTIYNTNIYLDITWVKFWYKYMKIFVQVKFLVNKYSDICLCTIECQTLQCKPIFFQ